MAILPGQSVRIYSHELPATSKRDRLKAAGFSIEGKVAQPLAKMHIALDDTRIGVMSKAHLEAALEQLLSVGLNPSAAYADFDMMSEEVSILDRVISGGSWGILSMRIGPKPLWQNRYRMKPFCKPLANDSKLAERLICFRMNLRQNRASI